ncbi:hypothetical protein Dimus_014032 [Dionaea muscipula]
MSITLWVLILWGFCGEVYGNGIQANVSIRPDVVNVGGIIAFNSVVGEVAKVAIEAALDDVNSSPDVLPGTKLRISMMDSNYSGFLGIVEAMQFMENETVAIIGPQSSVLAHVICHIANDLQVPLLSFAATEPTLSSLQFPFFVRTTQNDMFQMTAIADMIDYYRWREVIAIYTDDDYGRNGMISLGDKLAEKRCKISYKAALNPQLTREDIVNVLVKVALTESRILVLHTYADYGLKVLDVAKYLGMMDSGFVWIATNWLSDILDTKTTLPPNATKDIQGLITLRMHTPDSKLKSKFISRWTKLTSKLKGHGSLGLSTFGLYAYDTVWILARALDTYFDQGGNISFSKDSRLTELQSGDLNLNAMSIFDGGQKLLRKILEVKMTGLTGPIGFNPDRNLIHPAYEIINVMGTRYRRIGYWSNYSGLSVKPPETFYSKPLNRSSSNPQLYGVIWPGQRTDKPRGWVFPNNGRRLRIGVPNRVSYREFIDYSSSTGTFTGYCIDVFVAAVKLLPYAVPYELIPFGDGRNNPSCTTLIEAITHGVYDAAIGDIAITTNRTRMADFTQPYIESGLVVVAPVQPVKSNEWAFLKPFTPLMWVVTCAFFVAVGAVVWIVEHRRNDDFRGTRAQQLATILWFSLSTMFFAQKENTVSTLGRCVLIIWLFVVLIISSSYTASLSSMLTVEQLSSTIKGIESLLDSNDPIGYQQGSFSHNFLREEYNIPTSRLIPLNSADEYTIALKKGPRNGGVAAVVDERAYAELFLATKCEFAIVGKEFTKTGWGFAFRRDSPLAEDVSTAVLKLSENGELQRLHDKWLSSTACSSEDSPAGIYRLEIKSFWGLFLMCGVVCFLAFIFYLAQIIRQFKKHCPDEIDSSGKRSSTSSRIMSFLSFMDEKEEDVLRRSQTRQTEKESTRSSVSVSDGSSINGGSSVSPTRVTSNRGVDA